MWRACVMGLAGLCFFLVAGLADEKQPATGEYFPPEDFLTKARPTEYLPHARRHLQQNPKDSRGPRIALDMLMFATAMQDQEGIKGAKQCLLFQYGGTLPAAYLIRTSKADDLRGLLKSTFTATQKPLDNIGLQQFHGAVMNCYRTHGPSLADDELWAQAALSAPNAVIAANCRQQIKTNDNDAAKLLAIALDTQLASREKFVRLQELKEFETARAWQAHLFAYQFSDADRADMSVRTVVVENLLKDHKFIAALEILTELTKTSPDPKLLFCRGWSEAATDQVPAAIVTLNEVANKYPKSPWAESARELASVLSTLSANLEEHIAALDKVCVDLKEHTPDIIEMELHWGTAPAERVQTLLGLDFIGDGIELVVHKADKPLLGYSSGSEGSRFFVDGDANIHRFKAKGASPVLNLNVSPSPSGYSFNFNFNFSSTPGGLRSSIDSLLHSPAFATPEARESFVRYQMKQGAFPAKVVTVNGQRSFRWLFPQPREPKMQVAEIRLTPENHLASLAWSDKGQVRNIRYGSRGALSLSARKWPDLPISEGTEMGPAEMFRLMGTAMELLNTSKKSAADSTATKPGSIRR